MKTNLDQNLLRGFAAEAKSYLPEILRGIVDFRGDPTRIERLEESHRHAHTIKGAAAMIGLEELSQVAVQFEEAFENIAAGRVLLNDEAVAALGQAVAQVGTYLESALSAEDETSPALRESREWLRRLYSGAEVAPTELSRPRKRQRRDQPAAGAPAVEQPAVETQSAVETQYFSSRPSSANGYQAGAGEEEVGARPASLAEISMELLEVFLPEAEEHLRELSAALPALAEQPDNRELLQNIRRRAHSLKGAAGSIGFQDLSRLAHRMEDLLDLLYDGEMRLTTERLNLLFASTDALEDMTRGQMDPEVLRSLYDSYTRLLGGRQPVSLGAPGGDSPSGAPSARGDREGREPGIAERAEMGSLSFALAGQSQLVRLPIQKLDEVVNLVTELIISRASFEQRLTELGRQLEELRGSAARLSRVSNKMEVEYEASALGRGLAFAAPTQINNGAAAPQTSSSISHDPVGTTGAAHGFDDLEFDRYTEFHLLLRSLTEATNDVQTLDHELGIVRDNFEGCLNRQGRLCSDLQDKIMRLRMVPLSTLSSRLQRAVRTTGSQRGKLVRFVIEDEQTQLDKTVIEEMADPLLHILRNAVDHGIEPPAVRRVQGKDPTGTIRLRAYCEGTLIIIEISDDGGGIDPERLRLKAIEGGYLSAKDAARVPVEDLYSLLFMPGFSTAPEVSEISGRGVGLDVARVAIHRLKGGIRVTSHAGSGATFTVRLPMTLAVMNALMARIGGETYAIPLLGVKQMLKIGPDQIDRIGNDPVVKMDGAIHPLLSLARLLNRTPAEEKLGAARSILILNVEERTVAVEVDETLGGREIVVKNLGNHLRQVRGVMGATLMGNGSVALILNMAELVRDAFRPRVQAVAPASRPAAAVSRHPLTVMIVDDSLSVRRVLANLLQTAGWKPVQAKDGLDALEMLPTMPLPPDVVLLDIEMPRMDGYELISVMRRQKAYERTPIIVLTSRAGQKHREKAFELGATDYLVKPYQDEALLGLIRQLAHTAHSARVRG